MKNEVALIIIYNHQYNKNIDVLEAIYKNRFSNIYHLVPFYLGEKTNVIPVYDCSFYFQGYVSQGLRSYFKEEYSHYFFIADDLILNPRINEDNYQNHLKLNQNTSFIPYFDILHEGNKGKGWWHRIPEAFHWNLNTRGVEANNQLPSYEKAIKKFSAFGLTIQPLEFKQIWQIPDSWCSFILNRRLRSRIMFFYRYLKNVKIQKTAYHLPYPLVGGYSDIFVVSSKALKEFCHYCGVFAATKLFVEVAIPTSIVLASDEIITEKDLDLQGKALWIEEDFQELEQYEASLSNLMNNFPAKYLYLHPIKLSKWNTK